MDHSTISLKMATMYVSQIDMSDPKTHWQIYDSKLGINKCDNFSMSLQMGYIQGANQSSQVLGLCGKIGVWRGQVRKSQTPTPPYMLPLPSQVLHKEPHQKPWD